MPARVHTRLDGDTLAARKAGEADEAVVCVHGLSSSSASLARLVDVLAEEGYTALAPDLRGHGASDGPRGHLSQAGVLRELQAWHDHLASEGAEVTAIVGHSLGGFWAMAAHDSLDVDAVGLVATPVSIRAQLSRLEELGYRLGGLVHRLVSPLGLDPRVPNDIELEDVLAESEDVERARREDLLQDTIPLANARELLALDGAAMAEHVDAPTLVAHAADDRLVPAASTRQLYDALPEPCTWLELPGPHECFYASGGQRAARELARTLDDVLAGFA